MCKIYGPESWLKKKFPLFIFLKIKIKYKNFQQFVIILEWTQGKFNLFLSSRNKIIKKNIILKKQLLYSGYECYINGCT